MSFRFHWPQLIGLLISASFIFVGVVIAERNSKLGVTLSTIGILGLLFSMFLLGLTIEYLF